MSKKVTIISQDYDNCFAIMTNVGLHGEFNGVNKKSWESYRKQGKDLEIIASMRQKYNEFLTEITKDSAEVHVYVGSDRQSFALDRLNASINKNGSVFPALVDLCNERSAAAQPWVFEPLLLADPKVDGSKPYQRQRGEAYRRMLAPGTFQLEVLEPPVNFDVNKQSKRPMLINQMWDAYRQNPDADELAFHFIDDRDDLIEDILKNLDPKEIPPNMTVVVSKFDYIGEVMKEPEAMHYCGTIKPPAVVQECKAVSTVEVDPGLSIASSIENTLWENNSSPKNATAGVSKLEECFKETISCIS
jgi:hypothetical protein